MLRPDGGHRAGTHFGDRGGVDEGERNAVVRIEQVEDGHLRGQVLPVVFVEVADHLHARDPERLDDPAQDVEVALVRGLRHQMDARLDDGLAVALRSQRPFYGRENVVFGQRQARDVHPVEI